MVKISKSILVTATLVFAASMASQVCCYQDWSELFAHDHQAEEIAHRHSHNRNNNNSSNDKCGPHKYIDVINLEKIEAASSLLPGSFTVPFKDRMTDYFPGLQKNISFPFDILQ